MLICLTSFIAKLARYRSEQLLVNYRIAQIINHKEVASYSALSKECEFKHINCLSHRKLSQRHSYMKTEHAEVYGYLLHSNHFNHWWDLFQCTCIEIRHLVRTNYTFMHQEYIQAITSRHAEELELYFQMKMRLHSITVGIQKNLDHTFGMNR